MHDANLGLPTTIGNSLIKGALHRSVYLFQALRRSIWWVTRPSVVGVHGIPLTPEGKIVLVTLSYAHGWRLPGGGQGKTEDARSAMVRELREEIGLIRYDRIELVERFEHRPDYRRAQGSLFVVRGVLYRPKWSLEVKEVGEFELNDLPEGTASITRELLDLASAYLK